MNENQVGESRKETGYGWDVDKTVTIALVPYMSHLSSTPQPPLPSHHHNHLQHHHHDCTIGSLDML